MNAEKQHMNRELAGAWTATDELRTLFKMITISEKSMSTPCGTPIRGARHALSKPLMGGEYENEASETYQLVTARNNDFGV